MLLYNYNHVIMNRLYTYRWRRWWWQCCWCWVFICINNTCGEMNSCEFQCGFHLHATLDTCTFINWSESCDSVFYHKSQIITHQFCMRARVCVCVKFIQDMHICDNHTQFAQTNRIGSVNHNKQKRSTIKSGKFQLSFSVNEQRKYLSKVIKREAVK